MNRSREPVYSDEYLEYWGKVFESTDLAKRGYAFEDFIKNPRSFLKGSSPLPLLSKQRAVQQRLDSACQSTRDLVQTKRGCDVEMHGGRLMQPTHKRSHAKCWKTRTSHNSKRRISHA